MSLKSQFISGVKWSGASSGVGTAIQLLQLVVLGRLIAADDFGLMAMTTIVIGLAQIYADMGVSSAIIQRQEVSKEVLSTLYWLSLFLGAGLFLIVLGVAPLISTLFGEPRLESLLKWAALIFLITPLGQQFQLLLEKSLRFKDLALIEITGVVLGFAVAVVAALLQKGVYALIFGQLANTSFRALVLSAIGFRSWTPKALFKPEGLKGFIQFGLYQMGERSVNYLAERLDQMLIGSMLGAEALGYYSFAFTLAAMPISKVNSVLTRVAFPVFSRIQHVNHQLKNGYLSLLRAISMSNFPILLGMAAVAPTFLPAVFGNKWIPAVTLLQLLAIVTLFRSTGNPVGALLLAKGRADWGFKWNLVLLALHIPSIYIGIHFGETAGAIVALLVLQAILSIFNYTRLVRPLLGPCLGPYLRSMSSSVAVSVIAAACVVPVEYKLRPIGGFFVLIGELSLLALILGSLALIFMKNEIEEVRLLMFAKNP